MDNDGAYREITATKEQLINVLRQAVGLEYSTKRRLNVKTLDDFFTITRDQPMP